jgi:type VI secretion system protein ImpC
LTKVDAFNFEEFSDGEDHGKYLWMNAGWAYAARVSDAFNKYEWLARTCGVEGGGMVEGLPVHTFPTDDGDVAVCSTEIALSGRRESELSGLGLLSLTHCPGRAAAAFRGAQSCSVSEQHARLNHLLCVSRFAHHFKVITPDWARAGVEDCQRRLNDWIGEYVLPGPTGDSGEAPLVVYYRQVLARAKNGAPLAEAHVEMREMKGKPGSYEVAAWLRPSFQLESPTTMTRVVVELSGCRDG